eukprot:TRINITY_DN1387_c0_g1_i3.p1 TRINITY_DN1387_c0_g1~~TRINITY_DN1387_c0_g1_i3.p1  ORF type:complete len:358 (-),score=58.57 TRINITY_DN1387_c0_g1_i3:1804-2877(-)
MHALKERCPTLCCHFHVSGVSQATGKYTFVILYDAALSASDGAKRVIKTVYTPLHSKLFMTTTAALWRRSLGTRVGAHLVGPPLTVVAGAVLAPADAVVAPTSTRQDLLAIIEGSHEATVPEGLLTAATQNGAELAAPLSLGAQAVDALAFDVDGDPNADLENISGATPRDVGAMGSQIDPTDAYFKPPPVYYPSAAAIRCMKIMFTIKGKRGWVGCVREKLTLVRVALLNQYGAACRAFIQSKLPWWPVDKTSRRQVAAGRGGVSDQCAHYPYPVAVQRRHLPVGERTREVHDLDMRFLTLTEIYTAKTTNFHLSVAVLLTLFDNEPSVKAAIVERLGNFGVTFDPNLEHAAPDAL